MNLNRLYLGQIEFHRLFCMYPGKYIEGNLTFDYHLVSFVSEKTRSQFKFVFFHFSLLKKLNILDTYVGIAKKIVNFDCTFKLSRK